MIHELRTGWRRDVLVGLLAAGLTGTLLLVVGQAALREQSARAADQELMAREAVRLAHNDLAQARDQAKRALVDQAAEALENLGGPQKADAEAMRISTDAVAPEVPQGAYLLIDKKAASYAVGDIVVFREGLNNFLGRVVAVEKQGDRLIVERNREANRPIALGAVLGRGVLNTR